MKSAPETMPLKLAQTKPSLQHFHQSEHQHQHRQARQRHLLPGQFHPHHYLQQQQRRRRLL